jgi:integrase
MPTGSKYWRFKYRWHGKEKRLAFGVYPEVTLAEAREKRDKARKLLSNGVDPSLERKQARHQSKMNTDNTFEVIAREWHEMQSAKWIKNTSDYTLRRLENDIFPLLGAYPIKDITAPLLLTALRAIERRGAHEMAHRALQVCGQILRYAIATGRAERNVAADLKGALRPVKHTHFAALDAKELPEFIKTLEQNDARLFLHTRYAIRLLMLTFVRTSELINAKWDEFDFEKKLWVIPPERMKMRKSHIVPLSRQSLAILENIKQSMGYGVNVFPNQVEPRRCMSNNTILKAIERLGYKGQMTGHGFRALAMSTIKEQLGYRHEVVDRQLAHAPRTKVDAAYDRAQFLDERTKMMQEWADYLDSIVLKNS